MMNQLIGQLVLLAQKTEGETCDRVVDPGGKEILKYSFIELVLIDR